MYTLTSEGLGSPGWTDDYNQISSFLDIGQIPAGPSQNPINSTGRAIISSAQNSRISIDQRAIRTVRSILQNYYPTEAGKVSSITYRAGEPGLTTTRVGTGPNARGVICVGNYFVTNTNTRMFARRVLQVGHELRHIDQWRRGMIGGNKRAEREFLAHSWTAITREMPGTGRMPHAMRVSLIDAALGSYYCMPVQSQRLYSTRLRQLLDLRRAEGMLTGRSPMPVPNVCRMP